MSEVLVRIKRAVLAGRFSFSEKALLEMDADALTELDVAESILNATAIYKTLRSTSPHPGNTCTSFRVPPWQIMLQIKLCPTCGSNEIKRVRRDWNGQFKGKSYTVPALEFYECPACQERLFDPEAMRRIEAVSPAFAKSRRMQRSA